MRTTSVPACLTAAVLAVLAGATPVGAEGFKPAPNASYSIDLDTADSHFAAWRATDLTGLNGARSRVVIRAVSPTPTAFTFSFVGGGHRVAFALISNKPGTSLGLGIGRLVADKTVAREFFKTRVQLGETVDVEIDWTPEGEITARVRTDRSKAVFPDGESHTMSLQAAPSEFEVGTGGGELEVKTLQLGHTGP